MATKDEDVGLSIRFIREYRPSADYLPSIFDMALMLANSDPREDVSYAEKLSDALAFMKSRIH